MQRHRPFLMIVGMILAAMLVQRGFFWFYRDERRAERMIEEAPKLISQLAEQDHPRALEEWFAALTKAGHVAEARHMANGIRSPRMKSHALASVSIGLFNLHRMSDAGDLARSIPDQDIRDQTLRVVAMGLAITSSEFASDAASAVAAASAVKDSTSRSMGLADTAMVLQLMGRDHSAESATRRIEQAPIRDRAEATKAQTLAIKGEARQAIDTARSIADPFVRTFALTAVASQLVRRGSPGAVEAAETAVSIATPGSAQEYEARSALVGVLARSGAIPRARQVADTMTDPSARSRAMERIVEALREQGDTEVALDIARSIPSASARCTALSRLIHAWPEKGPTQDLARAVRELLSGAAALEDPELQASFYEQGATALAKIGQNGEARIAAEQAARFARKVKQPQRRCSALAGAARARAVAQPGLESAALACEVLEEIGRQSSGDRDTSALPEAVEALLKAVSDEQAVDQALAIKDPRTRALVLSSMADKLGGYEWSERIRPATRAASEALKAALSLNDPELRDAVVAGVLESAARADLVPLALAGARSISPSRGAERSQAFCTIATTVAERGRFDEAWQIAQDCAANEKLLAYAAILRTAGTEPAMRRFPQRHETGK